MEGKNKIIVYRDWIEIFEPLEDAEAGKLIKHFFRYVNDQNPESPDRLTGLLFDGSIKPTLKRDLKTWKDQINQRIAAGRRSAEVRSTKSTTVKSRSTKSTDKVKVNDNVINNIYTLYPSKCPNRETSTGKTAKDKDKIKTLLQTISPEHLTTTITRYVNECRRDNAYMKNFGTFLNNLPDYGTTDTPIVEQYDYSKHDTSLRTMMKIPVTVERLIAKGATLEGLHKRLKELEQ